MRYFCLFLIFFLSACAPTPVKRAPANSISEAEAIANRDDLTPMEQRQLLLSTPYIIELLPSFEGIVFLMNNMTLAQISRNVLILV